MLRRGHSTAWGRRSGALLVFGLSLMLADRLSATVKYGQVEIAGSVETQNLLRMDDLQEFQFIQNRNTATLRFEWKWLENGVLMNNINVPFIKRSQVYLLYKGVYDGYYDIEPGGNTKGVHRNDDLVGGPIEGNDIGDVLSDPNGTPILDPNGNPQLLDGPYSRLTEGARERTKFENLLQEAYLDLRFRDIPVSLRVGRQQVIWGESDQFRLMDIWNPLDLTWHLQQEDFEKIRIPLWMIKGIWDIGRIGPLSNVFIEGVWNPGDFQPGVKLEFLPYPWSIPIANPVRNGQIQAASTQQAILLTPFFDRERVRNADGSFSIRQTEPFQGTGFKGGDFQRNPEEASDVGVRFHGVTPTGLEFTTNYLYIRGRGIGAKAGTPFAIEFEDVDVPFTGDPNNAISADPNDPFNPNGTRAQFGNNLVFPAFVKAKFDHPYVHIFGLTGNYFEGDYTNTVFRMETAYALDEPFQTRDGRIRIPGSNNDGTRCDPDTQFGCLEALAPLASTERDVWAGMIGFDRPTWIRWLNRKTTWFLTGQLFWSYVNGKVAGLRGGVVSAGADPYFTPQDAGVYGPALANNKGFAQWVGGPYSGQTERLQDASPTGDFADDFRRWEMLMTFAGLSFYRGGTLMPFWALAYDPVNPSLLLQLKCDWFVTNNFIVQPQAKLFNKFHEGNTLDPWGVGGLNHRRDEIGLKVTWQF